MFYFKRDVNSTPMWECSFVGSWPETNIDETLIESNSKEPVNHHRETSTKMHVPTPAELGLKSAQKSRRYDNISQSICTVFN
jgi:hypothetical protein